MRVLVVGGTGFIGPFVLQRLRSLGHQVTIYHRGKTEISLPYDIQHLHGDRRYLPDFAGDLRRLRPEVVIDMRPMSESDARVVVDTLRGIARRIVAVSSMDVYRAYDRLHRKDPGPPDPVPLSEDAPLREKLYPYRGSGREYEGRSLDDYDKIPAERVVMGEPEMPGTVLRLPMVYGPGDNQHRLFAELKRMDDGRPAILLDEGLARWRWTRGYVEDVAAAIALAATDDRASGRIYNVGEADTLSMGEWVRAIGREAGWRGDVVIAPRGTLPSAMTWDIDTAQDLVCDTTRIRAELGYEDSVPRDEALRRTIAWERHHPPAEVPEGLFDYAAEDEVLARLG
jgi:nucleoside-diphosphate-sugar epimerase